MGGANCDFFRGFSDKNYIRVNNSSYSLTSEHQHFALLNQDAYILNICICSLHFCQCGVQLFSVTLEMQFGFLRSCIHFCSQFLSINLGLPK